VGTTRISHEPSAILGICLCFLDGGKRTLRGRDRDDPRRRLPAFADARALDEAVKFLAEQLSKKGG
jgi:hypothetical protein